jgi:hypothetical protein
MIGPFRVGWRCIVRRGHSLDRLPANFEDVLGKNRVVDRAGQRNAADTQGHEGYRVVEACRIDRAAFVGEMQMARNDLRNSSS